MRKLFIFSLLLIAISGINAQNRKLRANLLDKNNHSVMVVSHRGDWRNAPENSLQAIQNCIDMGVDMVEVDLKKTKDGHLIVMHDQTIDRTTTGKGKPENYTLEELRRFRLKNGAAHKTTHLIPTLEEVMLLCKGKILVNIDKGYDYFKEAYCILEKTGTVDQCVIKAGLPYEQVKVENGEVLDKVIFMPVINLNKEDAEKVLGQIERWQKIMMEKYGIHFIHASDEWYILADRELPCEDEYDGYLQLENGVGMLRLLETEVKETLEGLSGDDRKVTGRIATGKLAAPFIARYIKEIQKKYPNVQIPVTTIENRFFGEKITVSGLITGQDLKEQLSGLDLGEKILIPCSMLKGDEEIFLDDMTLEELSEALNTEIVIVDTGGRDLVEAVIYPPEHKQTRRRQIYEQTSSSDSGKA